MGFTSAQFRFGNWSVVCETDKCRLMGHLALNANVHRGVTPVSIQGATAFGKSFGQIHSRSWQPQWKSGGSSTFLAVFDKVNVSIGDDNVTVDSQRYHLAFDSWHTRADMLNIGCVCVRATVTDPLDSILGERAV